MNSVKQPPFLRYPQMNLMSARFGPKALIMFKSGLSIQSDSERAS